MLYDPKWTKTTTEPSLAGFVKWLETQDPNATFYYPDCNACALAQYLHSVETSWHNAEYHMLNFLNIFPAQATLAECSDHPTFSTVLRYAREALESTQ